MSAIKRKRGLRRGGPIGRKTTPDTARRAQANQIARSIERIARAGGAGHPDSVLSDWENEFVGTGEEGLRERLERYRRCFGQAGLADPGDADGPLSLRQKAKLREIARAVRRRTRATSKPNEPKP